MRILVADKFSEAHLAALRTLGEVDYRPALDGAALAEAVGGAHALIVRSTRVDRATIDAGGALGLIVRAGAGVNTIDVAAASERGVYVANCPGKNSAAVAELAIGLLLALDRRIADAAADLRAGRWDKAEYGRARGLCGRTLAVAGLGSIGRLVAARARALGMQVRGWSRSLDEAGAAALGVGHAPSLLECARGAHALSLHLPLAPETRGCVDADVLAALAPGAIVINTARGELVDPDALRRAIAARGLRAGLDVFAGEPAAGQAEFTPPLAELPGVLCTPHIGASTEQAQEAIGEEAVRIVGAYARGNPVPHCVNLAARSPARWQLVVRHQDKVGVLAGVLDLLRRGRINVQEVDNRIFAGARAAVCRLRLDERPGDELLRELESRTDEILGVELAPVEA